MTPADEERLRSWIFEVTAALVENISWRQEGNERRAVGQGGLVISMRNGCWYSHTLGCGHWSVLPLIELLRNCRRREGISWAQAWLQGASRNGLTRRRRRGGYRHCIGERGLR